MYTNYVYSYIYIYILESLLVIYIYTYIYIYHRKKAVTNVNSPRDVASCYLPAGVAIIIHGCYGTTSHPWAFPFGARAARVFLGC